MDAAITEIQVVPNQTGQSTNHHGISLGPEAVGDHLYNIASNKKPHLSESTLPAKENTRIVKHDLANLLFS